MKNKIINIVPFLIICIIVGYSWVEIMTTTYAATWRNYVALILVLINAALYFINFKRAVLLTGIILILATFNLLSFFTVIMTVGIRIGSLTSPEIQTRSLLLLIIYFAVNASLLINWYLDMKEEKARKRKEQSIF